MQDYSVLMSVYDKEKPEYLKSSIESILAQSVCPEQFIIVKDGELSDELDSILLEYFESFPNLFTLVSLEKNSGLAFALNQGLKVCRNELVARMDSDDISLPERCELELIEFEKDPLLSIVGSYIDEFIEDPCVIESVRRVPLSGDEMMKYARRRSPFNHPTVMFKKSDVIRVGGYNVERKRAQDYELFATMVFMGFHAKNIDKSLLKFRIGSGNMNRRKSWLSCKSHISVVYLLWKKKYVSLIDVLIVGTSRILIWIIPAKIAEKLSKAILRR